MRHSNRSAGIFYLLLGIFLILISGADLIFRFIGIIVGLLLINQALYMLGKPSLFIYIHHMFDQFARRFFGN